MLKMRTSVHDLIFLWVNEFSTCIDLELGVFKTEIFTKSVCMESFCLILNVKSWSECVCDVVASPFIWQKFRMFQVF